MMAGGFHLNSAPNLSNQWGPPLIGTIAYEKLHGKTQNASSDQQVSDDKDIAIHKPSFCSNCGFKVAAASKFCNECGSQLS
jgi:membrane protease subunit (stomatin/prohibitin family)